ncbi:hypothetical protein [Aliamphritea spongicola]|uniref:hypothetical protein n=1 Tax=Aliamphritea spongicola TaxID=707589 RepID=UPI00196A8A12|nr:hypothetical protein [Aliamphritea spongicola]MBN3563420.1 hypothetical protein [Aliamphritea spongicola]
MSLVSRDLQTRLASQGVLTASRVACSDVQAAALMNPGEKLDHLVAEYSEQVDLQGDVVESGHPFSSAKNDLAIASLRAARRVANETPEPLLVSAELNAVAECDYSDVLAQVAAEGADFVIQSYLQSKDAALAFLKAASEAGVPAVLSLDQAAVVRSGGSAVELAQVLYRAGAVAVGVAGYIGPQNTDVLEGHYWITDKRGSLYIH